jgi:hypothetical protein
MTTDTQFDNAPGWRPAPGDTVVGTVSRVDKGQNEYGTYPIVTVHQADGTDVAVHAFHQALRTRLTELRPAPGEKIGIKYFGQVETAASKAGTKSPVHSYVARVEGRDVDVWGQMEIAVAPAPAPAAATGAPRGNAAADVGGDDIPF